MAAAPHSNYDWHLQLATQSLAEHQRDTARAHLEACIEIDPEQPQPYILLGQLAVEDNNDEDALHFGTMAIHYDPQNSAGWHLLGQANMIRGDCEDALQNLLKASTCQRVPNAQLCYDLGTAYLKCWRYPEAISEFRHAVQLSHSSLRACNALALALRESGNYHEAHSIVSEVVTRNPNYADALANAGLIESDLGNCEEAEVYFSRALALSPNDWDTQVNRALNLLANGQFERGWPLYEARLKTEAYRIRQFPFPRWQHENLSEKHVLVIGEQGLGDEIMFASCIPDLLRVAKQVTIECDPRLAPLFSRSFSGAAVLMREPREQVDWLHHHPKIDFHVPAGSLPLHFRKRESDFPKTAGFLISAQSRVDYWRGQLSRLGPKMTIGISWRGGALQTRQNLRSIELAKLAQIFERDKVHLIDLQYGDTEHERLSVQGNHGIEIHHFPEAAANYDNMAALVCALDGVVSVQTAIVHLAGALGRPVWALIPYVPEWRYGRWGRDMVWYPSARLYRQQQSGNWIQPLHEVYSDLADLIPIKDAASQAGTRRNAKEDI